MQHFEAGRLCIHTAGSCLLRRLLATLVLEQAFLEGSKSMVWRGGMIGKRGKNMTQIEKLDPQGASMPAIPISYRRILKVLARQG